MAFPWLSASILFPIGAALLIPFVPDKGDGKTVRWFALVVALLTFLLTVGGYLNEYNPADPGLQLDEHIDWLPDLGLAWSVGADGLSMPLILLTSFITALAALAAWPVSFKPKLFYFLLLAMDGGQIAVFAVQDMLLFFLAWNWNCCPSIYYWRSGAARNGNMPPPSSSCTRPAAPCSFCWRPWRWPSSAAPAACRSALNTAP